MMKWLRLAGFAVAGLLCLAFWRNASAQQWQHYELTNFPDSGAVHECGSVADTLGHIHHYLYCEMGTSPTQIDCPVYYMRTDFFGHVLTDTVRINGFNTGHVSVYDLTVVGDGSHSWCTFSTYIPGENHRIGLYLAERDREGREVLPATLVSHPYEVAGGPLGDWVAAVLRAQDSTIHWIGDTPPFSAFRYCRLTTQGDTLIWARKINGTAYGCNNPSLVISPHDGRPWAGMIVAGQGGTFDGIRLVRFNQDTSQTVYHPMAGSNLGLYVHGFAMDGSGAVHMITGPDTAHSAYVILDSTMQHVRESYVASRTQDCEPGLKVDSSGNSLVFFSFPVGLSWLNRRADGTCPHPLATLEPQLFAQSFSIVAMDSERFAFTCMYYRMNGSSGNDQMRLYTYGFPPDTSHSSAPQPRAAAFQPPTLSAYPNPFGSSLRVEVPAGQKRTIALYNLLGREVWSQAVPDGVHLISVTDPSLAELPSGTYFLALKGNRTIVPQQIIHTR